MTVVIHQNGRRDLYLRTLDDDEPVAMLTFDTDLGWRVRRAGWATRFAADAVVLHHVFPGTFNDVLREEWRRGLFPFLVHKYPELRTLLPRPPVGLRPHSLTAQLALAGVLAAWWRPTRALGLAAMGPYAAHLARRGGGPRAAGRQALRDAVASLGLLVGSARERTLVL